MLIQFEHARKPSTLLTLALSLFLETLATNMQSPLIGAVVTTVWLPKCGELTYQLKKIGNPNPINQNI